MGTELDFNFDLEAAARRELKNKTDGVSPTAIQDAVNDYLEEHPVSGGTDETFTKEQVISILEGGN